MKSTFYPKLLVFLQFALIGLMLLSINALPNIFAIFIFLVGATIGIWALSHNQLGNFNIQPNIKEGCILITSGIYRWVRHPMYSSVILMMLGIFITNPSLVMSILFILLVIVLLLKAKREESLWLRHDTDYLKYRKKTKYFIPYIL